METLFVKLGSPWENGYVESLNGKLRDELLNWEIFYTWSPENAQKFLGQGAQGEDIEILASGKLSPREIVGAIQQEIENKLSLPSA